jgi:hypothetical protein
MRGSLQQSISDEGVARLLKRETIRGEQDVVNGRLWRGMNQHERAPLAVGIRTGTSAEP